MEKIKIYGTKIELWQRGRIVACTGLRRKALEQCFALGDAMDQLDGYITAN